jgi:hypothetical protein
MVSFPVEREGANKVGVTVAQEVARSGADAETEAICAEIMKNPAVTTAMAHKAMRLNMVS